MTANAMLGVIGTMIGGAACFCLGYHCALRWVATLSWNAWAERRKKTLMNGVNGIEKGKEKK